MELKVAAKLQQAISLMNYNTVKEEVLELAKNGISLYDAEKILWGGSSFVHQACSFPNPTGSREVAKNVYKVVEYLVKTKASIDKPGCDETSLMAAAYGCYYNVCKFLIAKGMDVNATGRCSGHTALQYAVGVPNYKSTTIEDQICKIVELLLENNADISKMTKEGESCLIIAMQSCNYSVCQLLIDKGIDVNAEGKTAGIALHGAVRHVYNESPKEKEEVFKIVKSLIKHGADFEKRNSLGQTCLMVAAGAGRYEVCKFLIKHGADINAVSIAGDTALHYAAQFSHADVVELLIIKGINYFKLNASKVDILQQICLEKNIDMFNHLTKMDIYSSEKVAESFELIGSLSIIDALQGDQFSLPELENGVSFWKEAFELKLQHCKLSKPVSKNQSSSPKCAFKDLEEIQTLEELEGIELIPDALYIQAVIKYQRIIGTSRGHDQLEHALASCKSKVGDLEVMKFLLEIKIAKYGFNSKEAMFCLRDIKINFLKGLNEKLVVKREDVLDVLKFVTQQFDKESKIKHPETRESKYNYKGIITQVAHMLYVFFAISPSPASEEVDTLKTAIIQFNQCLKLANRAHVLLHIVCSKEVNYREGPWNLSNLGKLFPSVKIARLILECGGDVNAADHYKCSALHLVASEEKLNKELVDLLISYGGHLDQGDHNGTWVYDMLKERYEINYFDFMTLKCLAAQTVKYNDLEYEGQVPPIIKKFIDLH